MSVPSFDVNWLATDDLSGVKHVTVYVAENGGDFKIWQRQVGPDTTQAIFVGVAGKTYEFLAVATDNAGNLEAASVANAVLPDDGSRQAVLETLGITGALTQTAETPLAAADRTYAANTLFEQSTQRLPGFVATALPGDLQNVLAPFALRGLPMVMPAASRHRRPAMVEFRWHHPRECRNVAQRSVRSARTADTHHAAVAERTYLDMAVDAVGQLWVMTGSDLLLVDAASGAILRQIAGPNGEPLTHALAIQNYRQHHVSSGSGIEIRCQRLNPSRIWKHRQRPRRRSGLRMDACGA
jgi:hypothetical protein